MAIGQRCNPWHTIPSGDSKMDKLTSIDEFKPLGLAEAEMDRKSEKGPRPGNATYLMDQISISMDSIGL